MGQIIKKEPLAETSQTSRGRIGDVEKAGGFVVPSPVDGRNSQSHVYPIPPPRTPKLNANIKDLAYRVLQ